MPCISRVTCHIATRPPASLLPPRRPSESAGSRQVHEDPSDLLDGGYGAVVDGLEPMEVYKFAVILTNAAGDAA